MGGVEVTTCHNAAGLAILAITFQPSSVAANRQTSSDLIREHDSRSTAVSAAEGTAP